MLNPTLNYFAYSIFSIALNICVLSCIMYCSKLNLLRHILFKYALLFITDKIIKNCSKYEKTSKNAW